MTAPNVVVHRCGYGCDALVTSEGAVCLSCLLLQLAARPPLRLVER